LKENENALKTYITLSEQIKELYKK
jgi:hypothetical protein